MSEESSADLQRCRQLMSSLADGDQNAADAGCKLWATDARAREAWHTYHLIGDALRSDDLAATAPTREAEFLVALRRRLAAEPTVLAPAPMAPSKRPQPSLARRGWRMPAAVAAGFVAVAAVLVASRTQAPLADGAPVMASGPAVSPATPATPVSVAAPVQGLGEPQWQVVEGQVIRDARLDSYLRAHRRGPIGVPGGDAGRFETVVLER
jgi:sigma-E factor negative regulatory protein RseA